MRIAIDYTAAVNQSAGIGRFVRSLVHALAEVDVANSYLLVHARPDAGRVPSYPAAPNFAHRQLRFDERTLTVLWQRIGVPLPADWLIGPTDLFHSPDFVMPPLRRARGVLTVHDLAFLLFPECADAKLRAYLEKAVPRSVRRADFIVADSENTKNDVVVLLGAAPERVEVVPGGVDPKFHPETDEARLRSVRERIGVGDTPFILFVGMIEPRKNLNRLMDAFALLKARLKLPHVLVLVGRKGWLWEDIVAHAERSRYADHILFSGFVPEDELAALYTAADVFAFPSLYEGFGLPPLEAMACGTPVMASQAASLPEVVGDAGLLVDPYDAEQMSAALELLILDQGLRQDLRRKGIARAAGFTWRAAAQKLLGVYRRIGTS